MSEKTWNHINGKDNNIIITAIQIQLGVNTYIVDELPVKCRVIETDEVLFEGDDSKSLWNSFLTFCSDNRIAPF